MAKTLEVECGRCHYQTYLPQSVSRELQLDVIHKLREYKKPENWAPLNCDKDDLDITRYRYAWNDAIETAIVELNRLYG